MGGPEAYIVTDFQPGWALCATSHVYQFARKASAFMPEMDSAGAIGVHAV